MALRQELNLTRLKVGDFGRLDPSVRDRIRSFLQGVAGRRVDLVLQESRDPRPPSRKQRGYYFPVVCLTYGEWAGYGLGRMAKEEAHEAFKASILGLENPGQRVSRVRSTTDLTPAEFVAYVDECVRVAAEMGCYIDPPDPDWRLRGFLEEMGRA